MKKIFSFIILCFMCTMGFAQLNMQTREQVANFKTVYECKMGYGDIRYSFTRHIYYFCGVTDNKYEKKCATILLGTDKASAISSLNDLENLNNTIKYGDEFIVSNGAGEPRTHLYKSQSVLAFKEDGIAGVSYALWKTNFDEARAAINNFVEEQ